MTKTLYSKLILALFHHINLITPITPRSEYTTISVKIRVWRVSGQENGFILFFTYKKERMILKNVLTVLAN